MTMTKAEADERIEQLRAEKIANGLDPEMADSVAREQASHDADRPEPAGDFETSIAALREVREEFTAALEPYTAAREAAAKVSARIDKLERRRAAAEKKGGRQSAGFAEASAELKGLWRERERHTLRAESLRASGFLSRARLEHLWSGLLRPHVHRYHFVPFLEGVADRLGGVFQHRNEAVRAARANLPGRAYQRALAAAQKDWILAAADGPAGSDGTSTAAEQAGRAIALLDVLISGDLEEHLGIEDPLPAPAA